MHVLMIIPHFQGQPKEHSSKNICSEGLNRQKFDLNCEEKLTFSFGIISP